MFRETLHPSATLILVTIYCAKNLKKRTFEFKIFNLFKYVQAKLHPSIKSILNIFVYLDIVELLPVGNS